VIRFRNPPSFVSIFVGRRRRKGKRKGKKKGRKNLADGETGTRKRADFFLLSVYIVNLRRELAPMRRRKKRKRGLDEKWGKVEQRAGLYLRPHHFRSSARPSRSWEEGYGKEKKKEASYKEER